MESEELARSQAESKLKSIMALIERAQHAEICDGDCPLSEKEIEYHNLDAIVEEIFNSPLSVEISSGWTPVGENLKPAKYNLLMTTGGPAVRITGSLDEKCIPETADLEYSDWNTPWTKYPLSNKELQEILEFAYYFSYQ